MPANLRSDPLAGEIGQTPVEPFSEAVRWLLSSLVDNPQPVVLPFTPVSDLYRPRFCQANTAHRISKAGGERVDGWMIWENRLFAEAEAHTVWRDPEGNIVDLTPRVDGDDTILFVPDPSAKVTAYQSGGKTFLRMLSNRTTTSRAPYTSNGQPVPGPTYDIAWSEDQRNEHRRIFGVDGPHWS